MPASPTGLSRLSALATLAALGAASALAGALVRASAEGGAGGAPSDPETRIRSEDFDGSESCARCHPRQALEWRGSAHAYAMEDPIYRACVLHAWETTGGGIGDHCIRCHSPIGTRSGELSAPFDPAALPRKVREGVSCETCHRMEAPHGGPVNDANFLLTPGKVFFGRLHLPQPNHAHESARSPYLESSESCGSCHDVVHHGLEVESTFAEWSASPFKERGVQCQDCHMLRYSGQAAVDGPFRETLHRHNFPAVTLPPRGFPNRGLQLEEVGAFLRTALRVWIEHPSEVRPGGELPVTVRLKNSGTGHNFPGASFRQLWLEVTVAGDDGTVVFRTGHLDANGDLMDRHSALRPNEDPALADFSDYFVDAEGKDAPYWLAARVVTRSLRSMEERDVPYRIRIPADRRLGSELRLRARLLFRPFRPYTLREYGMSDLAAELPIWELWAHESEPIRVVEAPRRKTEYRLPGDFETLAEAFERLRDGDLLTVGPGEHAIRGPLDYRGRRLRVRSLHGPLRTAIRYDPSVPEAERSSVVAFRRGEGPDAVLDGFTLEGGAGTVVAGERRGGGILIADASPTIVDNRIVDCGARGGIGGGIAVEGGAPRIERNAVSGCWAERGGGIAVIGASDRPLVLLGNALEGNLAKSGGGLWLGAGVRADVSRGVFAGNRAALSGGAIFVAPPGRADVVQATFVANGADAGAAVVDGDCGPIVGSIFQGNEPPAVSAELAWCLTDEPGREFPGKVAAFPLFRDPSPFWEPADDGDPAAAIPRELWPRSWSRPSRWTGGDYRLLPASPAIDAGDPEAPPDPDDTRADLGALWLEQPLKGFLRGDADGDGRLGLSDLLRIAERVSSPAPLPCDDAADIDDDGRVSPVDTALLAKHLLLGAPAPRPPFPECGLDPTFGEGLGCAVGPEPCRRDRAPGAAAEMHGDDIAPARR